MRAEAKARKCRFYVCDYRDPGGVRCGGGRLPYGARKHKGATAACGTADHRGCGWWDGAGREPVAHPEKDRGRAEWGDCWFQVYQAALSGFLEDDVRPAEQGP